MAGVEPAPPRCKRGALPPELHPLESADGWSRTTTAEGTRVTAWGAHLCSASAYRSQSIFVRASAQFTSSSVLMSGEAVMTMNVSSAWNMRFPGSAQ